MKRIEYGRFAYTNSLAYREGFLNQPLVNIWLLELKQSLKKRYPDLLFRQQSFRFIPT